MTNENVEICLNDLEDSEFGLRGFKHRPKVEGYELTRYIQEYRNLKYLQNDLKLIHILDEKEQGSIYFLSSKGKEVLNKGNWIKYCKDIESEKKSKKMREIFAFWFNILAPMFTLYLAYLAITYDTKSMKEELLFELNNTNQINIQQEVKSYMGKYKPKNMDSVLLNMSELKKKKR